MAWHYIKKGLVGDDTLGPIDLNELRDLYVNGTLKPDTLVAHPTETTNQWMRIDQLRFYLKLVELKRLHDDRVAADAEAKRQQAEAARQDAIKARKQEQDQRAQQAQQARAVQARDSYAIATSERLRQEKLGLDAWPNMHRCAAVYEAVARVLCILLAILAVGAFLVQAWIGSQIALSTDTLASAYGVGTILFSVFALVVEGIFLWLIYISLMCAAELLRCFSKIEANTRDRG